MLVHARLATELVAGIAAEDLAGDHRTRLAVERALEVQGEAADKVPATTREMYPDLPWSRMIALRHRPAHGYFAVDYAILHRVASQLLPSLLPRLAEVVTLEGADRTSRQCCEAVRRTHAIDGA